MTQRVQKLRAESLAATPSVCMERARIITETYKAQEGGMSIPELRGFALYEYVRKRSVGIYDGEMIVGEKASRPAAAPTFPEICCHTVEDMEIMDARERICFKNTQADRDLQRDTIIPFWSHRAIRTKILANTPEQWKTCYAAGIFTEFMEQRGPGHTVGDKKIYERGFKEIKEEILLEIEKLDWLHDNEAMNKKNELLGMRWACDAIMLLGEKYAKLAREMAATETDENKKADLIAVAETCEWVPENAPRTFKEAIQMYWFVHLGVTTELNPWDAFTPGRFDSHLIPFYTRETEAGTLTKDQAEEYLQCLWVKFNNQPAPPKVGVTLKESGTYTDFANINLGGVKTDGTDAVNEVTYIILSVIKEMRLLQPSSNVQISKKSPQKFLKTACDITRTGFGQPSMFNTEAVIQEMLKNGKTLEDARDGGTSGCVEVGAFGKEAYILTGYFNLPKIMMLALNDGYDHKTKQQLGPKTGDFTSFRCFDDVMEAFKKQMHYFADIKMTGNRIIEKLYSDTLPVPFLSIVIDDCIKTAKDYNCGGARYNTNYIQGVGIATITDSMVSIKKNVFEDETCTMAEMVEAVNNNFVDQEDILTMCKRAPKYGNDDDYADDVMHEIFLAFFHEFDGRPSVRGGKYIIEMLPTTCHVYFGEMLTATPNGRSDGTPVSEGISPEKGADVNGPTAVIKSAAKMDHLKTGGTLLNQKFTPSVVEGEAGLDNMANLVRAYFRMDGHHIQFNVVDKAILLEAQKKPEEFNDLIVRVAGYSDYFNNLDRALQDEIINRTEQKFGDMSCC